MVGGEISIENIAKVECTRYEWFFGDGVTEEIIFKLENGRTLAVSGDDGFFKKLYDAIEHHELVDHLGDTDV